MALGGGFEVAQQDAAAGGTGHAGTGRDDEASAAWFNPAALADGAGGRIALGASLAASTIKSEALAEAEDAPWSAQTEPALSTPPYLYGSFSHADWVVGVAANVPFAGGVKWAENWEQRFEIISSKPMFFRVAPFFGYAIGPVRLAAGMHVDTGSVTINPTRPDNKEIVNRAPIVRHHTAIVRGLRITRRTLVIMAVTKSISR